jgi:predicted transcriptional regulator
LILAGVKIVELRRGKSRIKRGDRLLLYASSPRRELVGMVSCGGIVEETPLRLWTLSQTDACLARTEYDRYFAGCTLGVAIRLCDPVRFEIPASLQVLRTCGIGIPQRYSFVDGERASALAEVGSGAAL